MDSCCRLLAALLIATVIPAVPAVPLHAQTSPQSSSQSSSQPSSRAKGQATKPATNTTLDPGTVINGIYRNKTLALTVKVPVGWVLRTDELNLNARDEDAPAGEAKDETKADAKEKPASSAGAKVLLGAFSRPPDAKAEDINASILIAAESVGAYPGLKDAAQYFYPLNEVAQAQGFTAEEDPYEYVIGAKTVVRGDFHKNVGSRVMHQSTLAFLSHGYAISITVIGGTEEEVEDLIDSVSFTVAAK
jgi:hypothetical protein